jgi:hypothetical protein
VRSVLRDAFLWNGATAPDADQAEISIRLLRQNRMKNRLRGRQHILGDVPVFPHRRLRLGAQIERLR